MKSTRVLLAALLLLAASSAQAEDKKIAVADVDFTGISAEDAAAASASLQKEVAGRAGLAVIPAADVKAAFGSPDKVKGCAKTPACIEEVADKIKADLMILALVEPMDKKFKITVTLAGPDNAAKPQTTFETMRKLTSMEANVKLCLDRLLTPDSIAKAIGGTTDKTAEAAAPTEPLKVDGKPAEDPKPAEAAKPAEPAKAAEPVIVMSKDKDAAKPADAAKSADAAPAKAADATPAPTSTPVDTTPASSKLKKNSVAVMDTVAQGAPDALAALTTQTITSYVANSLGMDVIAKDDIKRLVSFQQLQQLTGGDPKNAADIGSALGVERIVTSTLGKIGDRFQLTVVAMDTATAKPIGRGTRDLRSEDEIAENARDLAHFALKNEQRESKGYLRITSSQVGADIVLDGEKYGVAPLATPVRLLAGKHTVHVEKKGFLPFDGAVNIEVAKESAVEVTLIEKKNITVAGAGYLPWAGATAGIAVVGGVLSILSYYKALGICKEWGLTTAPGTLCYSSSLKPATGTDINNAEGQVTLYGNQLAFYGAIGSSVMGAVSVALFTTYFITGAAGAGGDEPPANAPFKLEPTPDGFQIRF